MCICLAGTGVALSVVDSRLPTLTWLVVDIVFPGGFTGVALRGLVKAEDVFTGLTGDEGIFVSLVETDVGLGALINEDGVLGDLTVVEVVAPGLVDAIGLLVAFLDNSVLLTGFFGGGTICRGIGFAFKFLVGLDAVASGLDGTDVLLSG